MLVKLVWVRGRVVCLYLVRGRVACASIEGLGTRRREGGDKSFGDVFFLGGRGPFSVINNYKRGEMPRKYTYFLVNVKRLFISLKNNF